MNKKLKTRVINQLVGYNEMQGQFNQFVLEKLSDSEKNLKSAQVQNKYLVESKTMQTKTITHLQEVEKSCSKQIQEYKKALEALKSSYQDAKASIEALQKRNDNQKALIIELKEGRDNVQAESSFPIRRFVGEAKSGN